MKKILIAALVLFSYTINAAVHEVHVANFAFTPSNLTISTGDQVKFVWVSGTHPVVSDESAWNTFTLGSSKPDTIITFNSTNIYNYHCQFHPSMTGTITVGAVLGTTNGTVRKISVYPNPAVDEINVEMEGIDADEISILSSTGNEILKQGAVKNMVRLFLDVNPGMYFLLIKKDAKILEKRTIVLE